MSVDMQEDVSYAVLANKEDVKHDLLLYGEALINYESDDVLEDVDVGIKFLQHYLEDDDFCGDLVRAILGDEESARYIYSCLDKHIDCLIKKESQF